MYVGLIIIIMVIITGCCCKPGVGQNIALRASPTVRNFVPL